jgi:hypothetical protein
VGCGRIAESGGARDGRSRGSGKTARDRDTRLTRPALSQFTIEFYRIRERDHAHATLDRISVITPDVEAAKTKAASMFDNLDMPQRPDGFRILDSAGEELCRWAPGD